MDAIPRDAALLICAAIHRENRGKWYSLARLQCWGCTRLSKGDPAKMRLSRQAGYRGCNLLNKRYNQLSDADG